MLVVAVLMVSYASSFRAYLEQRQQLADLDESIATSQANLAALQREKQRWKDPAFIKAQARKQFGFVMPGEIGYTVLDANGKPLGDVDVLDDPKVTTDAGQPEWYDTLWTSVLIAGDPPKPEDKPEPATKIKPPKPTPTGKSQ